VVTVLGIANTHDTGAALVEDGTILGAVNEGCLSRVKLDTRFPAAAINYLLAEYEPEIDIVAVGGGTGLSVGQTITYHRHVSDLPQLAAATADTVARTVLSRDQEQQTVATVRSSLHQDTNCTHRFAADDVEVIDHHRSHAASAYYTSGFDSATVVTHDAVGDGISSTVYEGTGAELNRVTRTNRVDSLGILWARLPIVFGFKGARHSGKFMGLAAYANKVPNSLCRIFREGVEVDGLSVRNNILRDIGEAYNEAAIHELKDRFGEFSAPQVARALQQRTEDVVARQVENAVERTGYRNVTLAGGLFANVALNKRIYELDCVDGIFVHQNMGDGGLGLGAALDMAARRNDLREPELLKTVYLGPAYEADTIADAIDESGIDSSTVAEYDTIDAVAERAGKLLAAGKVVALYNGRMEYGPRALGNRSILYQPTDETAIQWLNKDLDRTEFMPFAPVTLKERADECYANYDPETCPAANFMTITFDCTETMQERSPGAVHIDGTARPQLITEEQNPLYYKILSRYETETGIPTLINTSFNKHGEPIVSKPAEALRSFNDTNMDALILGTCMVENDI